MYAYDFQSGTELLSKGTRYRFKQGLTDSFYMQFVDGRVKNLLEANAECNACAYPGINVEAVVEPTL